MTPDAWTLVVVALVYTFSTVAGEIGRKAANHLRWVWAVLLLAPVLSVAIGWMVMVLWNMSVPDLFGLPTINLVPAIALGWLAGILFRGIAPRAVYDVDRSDDR
jgi:hypothetical protein